MARKIVYFSEKEFCDSDILFNVETWSGLTKKEYQKLGAAVIDRFHEKCAAHEADIIWDPSDRSFTLDKFTAKRVSLAALEKAVEACYAEIKSENNVPDDPIPIEF